MKPEVENNHRTISEIEAEWQLVQQAQQNPALFAPLYNKYFKAIYLFVLRRMDNEDLSADLTAMVFSKALYHLQRYTHRGLPFSSWLYRIALNEINAYYRKTKKERVVSFSQEALNFLEKGLGHEEDTALTDEREQRILESLTCLKEEDMVYIELRFFEGRSFKEIAEIQRTTENNAKVKMHRIIERLRKLLLQQ